MIGEPAAGRGASPVRSTSVKTPTAAAASRITGMTYGFIARRRRSRGGPRAALADRAQQRRLVVREAVELGLERPRAVLAVDQRPAQLEQIAGAVVDAGGRRQPSAVAGLAGQAELARAVQA